MSAYRDYLDNGGNPDGWETYAKTRNDETRAKAAQAFKDRWASGQKIAGNDVANRLRASGVRVPGSIANALQHNDTLVCLVSVTGRGLGRAEAKKIHKFVSENMGDGN